MDRDVETLDRLTALLRSASQGYRRAGADGPGLSDAFGAAACAHEETAEQLAAVRRACGAPAAAAAADPDRHAWAELPRAVAAGPDATAQAVSRAEGELLAELRTALDGAEVSAPVREALQRALDIGEAGRDRVLQRLAAAGG